MEIVIPNHDLFRLHALDKKQEVQNESKKNGLNWLWTTFPNIDIQSSVNEIMTDLIYNTSMEDFHQHLLTHSQSFQLLEYILTMKDCIFIERLKIFKQVIPISID